MSRDRCELLCLDASRAEEMRSRRPSLGVREDAAGRAQALADPTRVMLAAALSEGDELCVCDLAWISERSQNLVSHHLKILRAAGLVRSRRQGKMVMYQLSKAGCSLIKAVLGASEPALG